MIPPRLTQSIVGLFIVVVRAVVGAVQLVVLAAPSNVDFVLEFLQVPRRR